ncbi:MAG: hypothetical protein COB51_00665 [Moraxellaceae bacterium]|nr:MAG: hypothetical protein COB51_00665 [Moraxellaceae bacterium]
MLETEIFTWGISSYSFYFNYAFSIPTAIIAIRMHKPISITLLAIVPFIGFSLQLFLLAYNDFSRGSKLK